MGNGSKIDKLYANGGGSKLDQLYSDGGGDAATKAATRERKSNDMIDRNLQRAMRNGTPQQRVAAGVAYQERSSRAGYQQGGGINSAGSNQERDQKTGEKFTAAGLRLEGKENPADVVAGQAAGAAANPFNGGSGLTRGTGASVSSPTTSAGPITAEPATTPPATNGGAGNGTPAASDADKKLGDIKKQMAIDKFGKDITNWTVTDPEDQGKKGAQIFEYGKSLGISPEQIEAQADKARNGQVAEATKKSEIETKANAEKAKEAKDKKSWDDYESPALSDENLNSMKALADKIKSKGPVVLSEESKRKESLIEQHALERGINRDLEKADDYSFKRGMAMIEDKANPIPDRGPTASKNIIDQSSSSDPMGAFKRDAMDWSDPVPRKKEAPVSTLKAQASNDMKLQQREAAYRAPIDKVLETSSFLKRYDLGRPVAS